MFEQENEQPNTGNNKEPIVIDEEDPDAEAEMIEARKEARRQELIDDIFADAERSAVSKEVIKLPESIICYVENTEDMPEEFLDGYVYVPIHLFIDERNIYYWRPKIIFAARKICEAILNSALELAKEHHFKLFEVSSVAEAIMIDMSAVYSEKILFFKRKKVASAQITMMVITWNLNQVRIEATISSQSKNFAELVGNDMQTSMRKILAPFKGEVDLASLDLQFLPSSISGAFEHNYTTVVMVQEMRASRYVAATERLKIEVMKDGESYF